MAQDHRQKARRIFMELADLPESDRAAALERMCGGDAKLRAEIEALLRANGQAGGFMESPTSDKGGASMLSMHFEASCASSPSASEQPGRQIGPYKLLERIGEGGFGTVWMAEQREPVKRRVALKLIKLGMDTKQVIARFEAERQALAMMDHPNIAKVLDAGSTEAGRPYFVMEYIRGIPILEYCDQERLDTRARLELFMSVCHAIQHAHQKGIIHRDIKPSNVMVTLHDGVPVPKVIDFGVAKATNSELTTKTLFTEHRQMIGTPAYMSPEQAEMSGLDIDTRSDIYSLGVLLYELLTGTTPFDVYDLVAKGYEEMMRIIREDEPHKPSTRISSLGDTSTHTAMVRRVDAKTLGTLLRGDIDWIVMKCLEKDRSRRYETANGLAADIKRHLSDEPVTAGAPSAGYKLRKFVRRNRGQVIAAGALLATLLVGAIAFAWEAKVAGEQRDLAVEAKEAEAKQRKVADAARAEAQQQEARAKEQEAEAKKQEKEAKTQEAEAKKQAAIAEAVAKFQTDMLAAADPQKLLSDKVTVLQAMEAAVKELDQGSLADQPLVEAGVRDTIGRTLQSLARYDAAEPNLRKSMAIRRANFPAGHPQVAVGLNNFALLLRAQNKLTEAEPLFREALELLAPLPAERANTAQTMDNIATLLQMQNKLADAEPLFREALEIRRAAHPAGHPEIARGLNNLALLLCLRDRLAEAEPLCREALEIWRRAFPAGHPDIATGVHNLAGLLKAQNNLTEAVPLYREALEIDRKWLPAGHPDMVTSLVNLGGLLWDQKRFAEAEVLYAEGVDSCLRASAGPVPDTALLLVRHADVLRALGRLDDAAGEARRAMEMYRSHPAWPLPDAAHTASILAAILADQGQPDEAIAVHREALVLHRRVRPPGSVELSVRLAMFGLDLLNRGTLEDASEAEPLLREALTIREAKEPDYWRTFSTKSMLGAALLTQRKLAEAEPLLLAGYGGMKEREANIPPEGATRIPEALERLVKLYEAKGDASKAAAWRAKLDEARVTASRPSTRESKR